MAVVAGERAAGKSLIILLPLWGVVGLACALPLGWLAVQLAADPQRLTYAAGGWRYLGHTLLYAALAATLATAMGWPAALVVGRGRKWVRRALTVLLPITLLLPSLTYTYGWRQFLEIVSEHAPAGGLAQRVVEWFLLPQSTGDVLRCVWTLATWLWPVPALGIGLALRRMDSRVQQQAAIDGALWRTTLRMLVVPAAVCFAVTLVLAAQEFVVYETTGIMVAATHVRMLYQGDAGAMLEPGQRAAAAAAAALPGVGAIVLIGMLAMWGLRRSAADGAIETEGWPRVLNAPAWTTAVAFAALLVNVGVPIGSMLGVLKRAPDPAVMLRAFGPEMLGSLLIGGAVGAVALLLGFLATARRSGPAAALSLACFLIGGQVIAIADVMLFNRRWLNWAYNSPLPMVLGHVALFGWIALLAARATWAGPTRELREMAALDGAGPLRIAARVVWPVAWPVLVGAAMLTMALSMTEIAATALLRPMTPRVLITSLLTWVHIQRNADMVEASLMLAAMVGVLAAGGVALIAGARRMRRWTARLNP